jgi:ribosome modulation factor
MSNESESQENNKEQHQPAKSAWTIRAASWVGSTIGRWQKRRAMLRDEEFVRSWQRAWVKGRDSRWGGVSQDAVPYRRPVERQAWLAGWLWANTQPDRRNPLKPDRRTKPRGAARRRPRETVAASDNGGAISDPHSSRS